MTRIRFDGCDLSPRGARTPRYAQRIAAVAAVALLFVPLLLAGCGGGGDDGRMSKSDYERTVNGAGERLSTVFGLIDQNTATLDQFAIKVDRARRTLDDVTHRLSAVTPPEKAEAGHGRLVAALRDLSGELRSLAAAARTGSQKKTNLARKDLSGPARAILQAIKQLQDAGFSVNQGTSD
jgi:hypothetical protein